MSGGEIVTRHKPEPLPFITGDPPENKIPLKSWTAPSLNPNAPSLPPIPGCNVPQHYSGEQQPFINVTIEIDGPLDTFMKPVDGGVHLVAQAFTLSPGTGEKRAFGVTARNYDEIFGQGGFSKQTRDQLYGARMVITVIEQKSDGTRLRDIYTYYQYRWIDVVDAIEAANRPGKTRPCPEPHRVK